LSTFKALSFGVEESRYCSARTIVITIVLVLMGRPSLRMKFIELVSRTYNRLK